MEKTLRIGVVGAGLIGRRHIALIGAHPATELALIVDPLGGEIDGLTVQTSFPSEPALDAVIVAVPNDLHRPVTLPLLEAGVPVLLEKPVAGSIEDARAIVEAVERTGTPTLIGHHRRHNPIIGRAREIIEAGVLGDIMAVQASFMLAKPEPYFEASWRREPGAGPVLINLVHDIDCLRHLLGEIIDVRAVTSNAGRGYSVEDSAAAILRFERGTLATLIGSDRVASPWSWELTSGENPDYFKRYEDCYLIGGSKASLALPSLRLWKHADEPDWMTPIMKYVQEFEPGDAYARQLDHFIAVARRETAPLIDAADAMRTLEVALEIAGAGAG